MPDILIYGHFAVISSYMKSYKIDRNGFKRIALIELTTPGEPPRRIDSREKKIKQIIQIWENQPTKSLMASMAYRRIHEKAMAMADKFNKMWPLHFMAKEWPLPYYLPDHRIKQEVEN